jgi:hypothetical protein
VGLGAVQGLRKMEGGEARFVQSSHEGNV